ncbi:MAG: hypothetical protein RR387_07230 [Clostridiales bacterium]
MIFISYPCIINHINFSNNSCLHLAAIRISRHNPIRQSTQIYGYANARPYARQSVVIRLLLAQIKRYRQKHPDLSTVFPLFYPQMNVDNHQRQ